MLIMVTPPKKQKKKYNNRVKIIDINSNSNSFTNLMNHSNPFSVYLFIYSLIFENCQNLFLCLHLAIKSEM